MTMTTTPSCCCWRVPHAATARGRTGPATTREAKPQELDFSCPPPLVSDWCTRVVGGCCCLQWSLLQDRRLCPLFPRGARAPGSGGRALLSPLLSPLGFALQRGRGPRPRAARTRLWGKERQHRAEGSAGCGLCHGAGRTRSSAEGGTVSPCHLCLASRAASQLVLSPSWWGAAGPSSADHQY